MKKKGKWIVSLLLGLSCSLAAACASVDAFGEAAPEDSSPATQIPLDIEVSKVGDVYALNDKIYADFLTVDIEGESYEITACNLQYPSGKRYEKEEYELNELGEYQLYYTAKKGDKVVTAQKSFKVLNDNYYVTSNSSTAEYRENIPVKYSKATSIKEQYMKDGEVDGIYVSLADGDEFKLAKPIKVTEGMNDLFTLYFNDNYYDHAASNIVITLTDCYDPNNYINFIADFSQGGSKDQLMFRTAVKGDIESCIIKTEKPDNYSFIKNKIVFYRAGESYLYIYGQNRGTQINANRLSGYTFSLDTTNAFAYVTADMNRFVVNMLNDIDLHKDPSKHFYGFTNGEAYLSIKGVDYSKAAADFIVTGLSGHSQEELQGEKYEDEVAPLIQTSNKTENITVAQGTEIALFDAVCYDVNLTEEKVMAYYNYDSPNRVSVNLTDDRLFFDYVGSYALVYTAKDRYGNRAEKVVYLNSIATPTGKGIDYTENKLDEIQLGERIEFPDVSAVGLNGEVTLTPSVTFKSTGEKLAVTDNAFIALNAGEYEIEYLMKDGIYEQRFTYTVQGVASDNVAFIDRLDLPKYFMKGRTYYLDAFPAYTFETGELTAKDSLVYESVDGGEYQKVENYANYEVKANTSVRFKFEYNGASVESDLIQVVDCGDRINVNAAGYFVGDGNAQATFVEEGNYVRITATADATVEFINPISLSAFDLQFMIPESSKSFKSVSYVLQDYYDATKKITITYEQGTASNSLIINGESYALEKLVGVRREVQYYSNAIRDVDLENRAFLSEQFTTDKVMLSIYFNGVSAPVDLRLYKVNNQVLNANGDTARPTIAFKDIRGSYAIGEKVVVYPATVSDVFSTVNTSKTRVSVWDEEHNPVVDENGVELTNVLADTEYTFTLTNIGAYYIEYYAQDAFGNKTSKMTELYACDFTKPTVTLEGGVNSYTIKYAKVGETINIVGYTASDNVSATADLNVVVRVFTPRSEMKMVEDGKICLEMAGSYKITYTCIDEAGNTTYTYYTVKVK